MHKITGLIFLFTLIASNVAATGIARVRSSPDPKRFIGTWRLVSITRNGNTDPNRESHPAGLIYYDNTGHMAAQIMPEGVRPKYAGPEPTPDEAKAAITGYIAYFGTYTVDESARTVTHHRMGNIVPGAPTDVVRRYEFASDDRLILRPVNNHDELIWERIK
jgi:Lipocalin-like domain